MKHGIAIDHPAASVKNLAAVFGLSVAAGMVMAMFGMTFHLIGWMQKSGLVINASMVLPPELMRVPYIPIVGFIVHVLFSGTFGVVFFVGIIVWKRLNLPGSLLFLGLLYGIAIYVWNAGIMAPVMDIHPPFWQQDLADALSGFVARLVYGVGLAVFLSRWVQWPEFVPGIKS
ncbi:DUF1440 domain-containing protein [Spirochaeta africana]|uniref:DUF1440 domain-containing protein n=1 Tax=Spirochaeta africana TaxID=46355 RepID=UPI00024752A4|nr:DUF1440 domain-containing protein [Spirochaeta africana]